MIANIISYNSSPVVSSYSGQLMIWSNFLAATIHSLESLLTSICFSLVILISFPIVLLFLIDVLYYVSCKVVNLKTCLLYTSRCV